MYEIKYYFMPDGIVLNIYSQRGTWYVAEPLELKFKEMKEGELHEPSLKMNYHEGGWLLDAFKKALGPSQDAKDLKITLLETKLKATEAHLLDLQKLLKIDEEPLRMIESEK